MKKSILICHSHMGTGGIETSLVNLLSSLDNKKYDIDLVLYYPKGEFLSLIPDWVNIIPIWETTKIQHKVLEKIILSRNIIMRILKNLICNPFSVKFFIPQKHYDVSIAYSGYSNFIDLVAGNANSDKKIIWGHADFLSQCKIDTAFRKKFKKISKKYKLFDKIICVSNSAAENLKKLCPQYKSKISYLWNINKKRTFKKSDKQNIILDNSTYNIVTIARLDKYKGIETLIDAAKILKSNKINFKIYLMGDGPYRETIENKIKINNLENSFKLLGNVDDIFSVLEQADLYVSPSQCESFSNVTLESLICNIPVVATPTAGNTDIYNFIAPKNSMLLSKDFTPNGISDAIIIGKEKLSKTFTFDVIVLNKQIVKDFEEKIIK